MRTVTLSSLGVIHGGIFCGRVGRLPALARHPAARTARPSIQYVPLDAPAGMSQAVIVQGLPLVHTRQLLPLDR